MGDANVRRPVATRFEHGVDFGLLVHKSPFMADDRDPLVLSNYIFELLEVNPGVAGFLIQLHPDDVDAVVESVTAHAEKGAGTKTTLYVGQEEEEVEEVEEEEEDAGGVGAGGRKEKPHNPLMISVQKVRIRPGKGKGQSDGWFPQPLTHNTRRVCTDDPENKLPMHSLCPTREWEREWYGVTTPNIVAGQGVILFPFGATPPLIGEAEEVVAAEPLGAFNRDPNDLVQTVGGKLVVNHLLEHDFLSAVQLQSLLDDLDRVPLSEKAPIFNENPPIVGRPQDSGTRRTMYGNYGGANHHRHNPHKLHDLPVLKRVADRVLETAKKTVVGGVGWSCTILDMAEISSYDHTPQHLHRDAPPYTIPEGTLIVNCLIMLTHNHEEEDGSHFLFVPSSSSGFPDPWVERAVPFKRGTAFFFNALDVHRGSGIPKASPTGVSHPRLMAFFAIELTVGGNLRFPNLHVTQSIKRPQFLTCTVILTGDGKGMQAMGGAGSKCWLCKDPNGIVEQMGVESTSRWGSFLRSVTPDRRPGDYQHAACRILNGIAKRIETTLQALPPSTPGKAQALAALQAFKQALKDETAGIPLRERLPSASRATEKDFDLTSTKVFLTSPPFQRQFVECLKEHVPTVRTPGGPMLWVVVHVMVKCIEGLYELWRVRELYTLTQVERHRALTTKFSKAWGDSGWSPTRWIHWCLAHSTFFAEKWRNIFQFSSIPTEYRHGPYKRRLKNCFKGWSLVRPSMSLRHMHHCMSMNALEQGLLGLEAAKASDIDDFV